MINILVYHKYQSSKHFPVEALSYHQYQKQHKTSSRFKLPKTLLALCSCSYMMLFTILEGGSKRFFLSRPTNSHKCRLTPLKMAARASQGKQPLVSFQQPFFDISLRLALHIVKLQQTVSKLYSKNVYSSHEMTTVFQLDFQLILAGKYHQIQLMNN